MMSASIPEKTKPRVVQDPEPFTENQSTGWSLPQMEKNLNTKIKIWEQLATSLGPVHPLHGIVNGRCTCGDPKCAAQGKHPWSDNGFKDATIDPHKIRTWVEQKPNANIGIATGGTYCVVDVDGEKGEELLEQLEEKYGPLPETWETVTGREKGRHLYFLKPEHVRLTSGKLLPGHDGLDLKAEGGYVVGPGSCHMTGRHYRVLDSQREMMDLPKDWLEFLSKHRKKEPQPELLPNENTVKKGHRNNTIFSLAMRLWKEFGDIQCVQAAVNAFNHIRCDPPLESSEVQKSVASACKSTRKEPVIQQVSPLVTDAELSTMELPPIRWIVLGLIAAGLCLLVGKSKVGKSLLAMNLAYAIATGTKFLGNFDTELGSVIYLAMEDNFARVQRRFRGVSGGQPSGRIYFQTKWPRFDDKGLGLNFLERELDYNPDCKLVIIDTFQKIRAPKKRSRSDYEEDYEALEKVQEIALDRNIAMMLLHHMKKEKTDDPLDSILGSTALPGVADTSLILDRPRISTRGTLTVIGRDLEDGDREETVELSSDRTGTWTWIGSASKVRTNENDNKVLQVLTSTGQKLTEIVQKTGLPQTTCVDALDRLVADGILFKGQDKSYRLAPDSPGTT